MNFFIKLKALFKKDISILPYQRLDMVSFVKLRNNAININCNVTVEENYNFVIVYFNKVCDILQSGDYKINEDTVPKLYRFSKTPFGLKALTTRSIDCDAYYVNLKEFANKPFKTTDKVTAINNGRKVKINLVGTFSMKVIDTLKFMKALCNDYAIIRNKRMIKDICATVGFEVSKVLNSKDYSIDDYIFNKDKIISTMQELVNNKTNVFGIEVSNFNIKDVCLNKKKLNEVQLNALQPKEEKENSITEKELSNLAGVNIDASNNGLDVVYVGGNKEEQKNNNIENKLENGITKNVNNNFNENKEDILTNKIEKEIINNFDNIKELSSAGNTKNVDDKHKVNNVKTQDKKNENIVFKKNIEKDEDDVFIKNEDINTVNNLNNKDYSNVKFTGFGVVPQNTKRYGCGREDYYKQPEPMLLHNENKIRNNFDCENKKQIKNEETKDKQNLKQDNKANENNLKHSGIDTKLQNNLQDKEIVKKPQTNRHKKICSVCGEIVLENGAKFCEKCGNKLNNYKTCDCCGAKNIVDATECCVCKSVLD